jgi:gamma-glutamyltranspeptidase / glutathione hydrolase
MTTIGDVELPQGGGMGGGLVAGLMPPPESMRPTVVGGHWAVVAGHPIVSQVAASVLAAGGNAVDAGVAAGLASNVVQVDMANFGGIAPILVRPSESTAVFSVCGVGVWGRTASIPALVARYGQSLPLGGAPCIVPGAPAGWIKALEVFGTWSFASVVKWASLLAQEGFPVDHRTSLSLQIASKEFQDWTSNREIYCPNDRAPTPGEWLVQKDLAALLGRLAAAEHGPNRKQALRAVHQEFYSGEIAARIASFVTAQGGFLTPEDLSGFEAEVSEAPSIAYNGWQVSVPPLWSQGLMLLQALGILRRLGLGAARHNSPAYLHALIEALKLAFSDRELFYGDPKYVSVDTSWLLSDDRLTRLAGLIGPSALPNRATSNVLTPKLGSTTAIVVIDGSGTVFCAAPSDTIDGGPIIPGLGILCSPRGVQSRLDPNHPNALAPGKRPCVTPAAAIALRTDGPEVLALASPGGDVIVQAMLQAFLNVDLFGMTAQQAVEAPRVASFAAPSAFHPHPEVEKLVFVEQRISTRTRVALTQRGHRLVTWPAYEFDAGSVQLIHDIRRPDARGRALAAAADPRRSAYAAAF